MPQSKNTALGNVQHVEKGDFLAIFWPVSGQQRWSCVAIERSNKPRSVVAQSSFWPTIAGMLPAWSAMDGIVVSQRATALPTSSRLLSSLSSIRCCRGLQEGDPLQAEAVDLGVASIHSRPAHGMRYWRPGNRAQVGQAWHGLHHASHLHLGRYFFESEFPIFFS